MAVICPHSYLYRQSCFSLEQHSMLIFSSAALPSDAQCGLFRQSDAVSFLSDGNPVTTRRELSQLSSQALSSSALRPSQAQLSVLLQLSSQALSSSALGASPAQLSGLLQLSSQALSSSALRTSPAQLSGLLQLSAQAFSSSAPEAPPS